MSLLQNLSYKEYQKALNFSKEQCEQIAKQAKLRSTHYQDFKKPGQQLIKDLDRRGYSVNQYHSFQSAFVNEKNVNRPKCKIAILIGNNDYKHLSKLATPITDCQILGDNLKSLGFVVIILKNITVFNLKKILDNIFAVIPKESYCFLFYAGHGFELHNFKFILSIDSPTEHIGSENVMTDDEILNSISKCQPDYCVLLMDMCRLYLEQELDPNLWHYKSSENHDMKNLTIGYSTQSAMAAYEEVQLECSKTIDNLQTYELRTCDLGNIVPGTSQYIDTLCRHIKKNVDVGTLLDKVHEDLENAVKKQTPTKVQIGVTTRSLHDPCKGDNREIIKKLKEIASKYQDIVKEQIVQYIYTCI